MPSHTNTLLKPDRPLSATLCYYRLFKKEVMSETVSELPQLPEDASCVVKDIISPSHEADIRTPLVEENPHGSFTPPEVAYPLPLDDESLREAINIPLPLDEDDEDDGSSDNSSTSDIFYDVDAGSSLSTPRQQIYHDPSTYPIAENSDFVNTIDGSDDIAVEQSVGVEPVDAVDTVKDMYRILDLVSERGSSGYVDKIVVCQGAFRRFANDACPGAYASMTKVDFATLDDLQIKPLGLYGSQSEIVRYLEDMEIVNGNIASRWLTANNEENIDGLPGLRSGIYVIKSPVPDILYVVYWPEATTWNDDANDAIARNRVTFMRYLTKITDQRIALISREHADSLVWERQAVDGISGFEDGSDRMFPFEVLRTDEQEENATARPGFTIRSHRLAIPIAGSRSIDPNLLKPQLVHGETVCGYATVQFEDQRTQQEREEHTFNSFALRQYLRTRHGFSFGSISEDTLAILTEHDLAEAFPEALTELIDERAALERTLQAHVEESKRKCREELKDQQEKLAYALRRRMARRFVNVYSTLCLESLASPRPDMAQGWSTTEFFSQIRANYPSTAVIFDEFLSKISIPSSIKDQTFQKIKADMLTILERSGKDSVVASAQSLPSRAIAWGSSIISSFRGKSSEHVTTVSEVSTSLSDVQFLKTLPTIVELPPSLEESIANLRHCAEDHLAKEIDEKAQETVSRIEKAWQKDYNVRLGEDSEQRRHENLKVSRKSMIKRLNAVLLGDNQGNFVITDIASVRTARDTFLVRGTRKTTRAASLKYTIHILQLTQEDKHSILQDKSFVPNPKAYEASDISFEIPASQRIVHIQLLQNSRCLVMVQMENGDVEIFVDSHAEIRQALRRMRSKKVLKQDKIGDHFLMSFNEATRVIAVCNTGNMVLHQLQFDELYTTLGGLGTIIELSPWYDNKTILTHIVFRSASEELLIVDGEARARLYSFDAQQMRPSSVQLVGVPLAVHSSPDGSCFLCVSATGQGSHLQVHHWSSFGSTAGIHLDTIHYSVHSCILTSFATRNAVYFLWLEPSPPELHSLALTITHKVTAFTIKEGLDIQGRSSFQTLHNSLLDFHEEMWTKFPVIPAVTRQILLSPTNRRPCSLTYISHLKPQLFQEHYKKLTFEFQRATRKPTGTQLSDVHITGASYDAFLGGWEHDISSFRLGEWLVNILCLIPIHIAVAQDNRFLPLKDGVFSSNLEQSLLGATVDQIVDQLSFGWYESIFSSYSARKPVRVVSSMGEQSVGKSFMLNHFADTSFAGSAMRTTEGVWMSVTPTEEALIVSLDFEGVHSIERSAQEDTLLVLFNVAISNLVLFRNNFALSRDLANLFQSFQSSSTVLDPSANPSLFQSDLVVIIKDVIDSDKEQIVKEFSLKFQRIVEVEQSSNFITRLHGGKLHIIPWPVIESRQFYELFPRLKVMLDRQPITHPRAGVFLQKLKTLMAKLKANDWSSLDRGVPCLLYIFACVILIFRLENLVSYRAQRLSDILATALKFGASEVDPDFEPLKDFDSGEVIDFKDSRAVFHLDHTGLGTQGEAALTVLQKSWPGYQGRHETPELDWFSDLRSHLLSLGDDRINLVKKWMTVNTARFSVDSTFFDPLQRKFEHLIVTLQSNIQLCQLQCAECDLFCLRVKHHEGQHTCGTDHHCVQRCRYDDEHETPVQCGLPAGHTGVHFCDISAHLCGATCQFAGKKGCLRRCSKPVNHLDDDHMCPARSHGCGEPCCLSLVPLPDGSEYHCQESCPFQCRLCKRLCAVPYHLHGLDPSALHLCGEEHTCPRPCHSRGVCRIETAPQSIEATFTGRHETFQYTKYSQIAKRLQCRIMIPQGETEHKGPHTHSTDTIPFHFCEARCKNCGYFCTLPLDHTQQEHETSHGSMSSTRWQIIGNSMEVGGRQFASNDDGAPMMCSMVCRAMGRHIHIADCQSEDVRACSGNELQHIPLTDSSDHDHPVDAISHSLYWRRMGFKDPYSQDEQADFARCDRICAGTEHQGDAFNPAIAPPSYCHLPLFHAPLSNSQPPPGGTGYVSADGHHFGCTDPAQMQRKYHIIFVVDRSSSMANRDNRPLRDNPTTLRIVASHDDRLGAVYSSLFSFWTARRSANWADAYTLILFNSRPSTVFRGDLTSTPDELLGIVLQEQAYGWTSFDRALNAAEIEMEDQWVNDRQPVVIFLSDGECDFNEAGIRSLCRKSLTLGTALSFHSVSFGSDNTTLRSLADIANTIQNSVSEDAAHATIPSSYTEAITTIQLAETFLGISNSLRKTRGSLVYSAPRQPTQ
ncbi:hypothetical protein BDY19DRAFT_122025 [Irpex rosettiformis]|uniref:Uncharacterized protein n=1 Tax=Irpex rosettiformis TaxID=378272 RepID=A0ACB8U487_9APHY|nr:hypothetical protein BDY19DRAFT_122025 [Irpex rosettiformis]